MQEDLGVRMRKVWKYRVAVVFLLVMLLGGTAAISATVMGITFALALAVLVGMFIVLFAISRFKKEEDTLIVGPICFSSEIFSCLTFQSGNHLLRSP